MSCLDLIFKYRSIALFAVFFLLFNAASAQKDNDSVVHVFKNGEEYVVNKTDSQFVKNDYIPWEPIKPEDILWKKRVWRQIEIYERNNTPLRDDHATPQENVFANILLTGIKTGVIKAYSDTDTTYVNAL